jgi:hypothetical protein
MGRVTNRVGAESLGDFLGRSTTAVLAHVDASGAVQAVPVAFSWREGRFRIGLPSGELPLGTPVALAVDDGSFWWELRAVLARGALAPAAPPDDVGAARFQWFEVRPDRVTAWDYDRLHEDPDARR